jgi:hypothetical protein
LFVFDDKGVHQLKYSASTDALEFKAEFAQSTWCLIDSNLTLTTVPGFILDLGFFIVQASSPRPERIEWVKKVSQPVLEYFLKPWTPSELIMGCVLERSFIIAIHGFICSRTLQNNWQSERDLLSFYDQYGPSARLAYAHAASPHKYGESLKQKLAGITYEEVFNIVNLNLSNAISHQITLISPGVTRSIHTVTIATPYIDGLLNQMHDEHVLEASAREFQVFNGFSKGKTSAGYILDHGYHDALCKERTWRVIPLKSNPPGPQNTHWTLPDPHAIVPQYLHISYENGRVSIDILDAPPPVSNDGAKTLPIFSYLLGAKLTLKDGYYRPSGGSEPTFDSFIYESATKTATTIQSTVSTKHNVSKKGLEWLQSLGVKKFRYILISAPGDSVDLPFPNKWSNQEPFIPEKYSLALRKYPL